MLPEIEYIRRTKDRITTPEELARKFEHKSKAAIDKSLSRALERNHIIKIGYGEYAHPDYQSPVPPPKTEPKSEWKNCAYTVLLQVCLNIRLLIENRKANYEIEESLYWIISQTLDKDQQKTFRTYLDQARKDLGI